MAAKSGGGSSSGFRGIRPGAGDIGPHNFKEHFDRDIIDYVREDVRLSTLQRKLVRENNTLVSHALACQVSTNIHSLICEIFFPFERKIPIPISSITLNLLATSHCISNIYWQMFV